MRDLKLFLTILLLGFSGICADCMEIVYPKSDNVTINSPTTFFIGSENPNNKLTINSNKVDIHNSGGFFYPVNLNIGKNIFKIDNGETQLEYTIVRNNVSTPNENIKYKAYDEPIIFITAENNVPLRSTPYNYGINRLQHYDKGIELKVVGEYGDFYKVQLARDDYAWISKNNVKKSTNDNYNLSSIESYTYEENPDVRKFTVKLNKKAPYTLSESIVYKTDNKIDYTTQTAGLDLVIFNVDGFPENKYEFHINSVGQLFGYKIYYKSNNELVIEVKNPPKANQNNPLLGKNITLDAGHGGNEYGAIGCFGDKEKDINLQIALKLEKKLKQLGAQVFMTRTDDSYVSLNDRVKFSKSQNSDIFISIHNNALPDSLANSHKKGTSVYYYYPQSKKLAKTLHSALLENLQLGDDKVRQESFAVVRNTESLAVLLEVGYMIVPEDNEKLISPEFQEMIADSIICGLEKYFNDL